MNNARPEIQSQCHNLLKWMQDRSDVVCLEKDFDSMFALYMECHEWIEEENPPVMILDKNEAK